jgi:hypothetical protein
LPLDEPGAIRALHVSLRAVLVAAAPAAQLARVSARATLCASYRDASGEEILTADLLALAATRLESGADEVIRDEIVPIPPPPPGAASIRFRLLLDASARASAPGTSAEAQILADDLRLEAAIGVEPDSADPDTPILRVHPAPAGGEVEIALVLAASGPVSLSAFDAAGRLVARLLDRHPLESGTHRITWDTRSHPSGAYFLRLVTGAGTASRKWLLIR